MDCRDVFIFSIVPIKELPVKVFHFQPDCRWSRCKYSLWQVCFFFYFRDSKVFSNISISYGMPPEGPYQDSAKLEDLFKYDLSKISYWLYGDDSNNSPRFTINWTVRLQQMDSNQKRDGSCYL